MHDHVLFGLVIVACYLKLTVQFCHGCLLWLMQLKLQCLLCELQSFLSEEQPLIWLQDPSFDPYAFAKVATRTASSEAGSAAACSLNVQNFFKELFALSNNSTGTKTINHHMKLCSDSDVKSAQDTPSLAGFLVQLWIIGVSCASHIVSL